MQFKVDCGWCPICQHPNVFEGYIMKVPNKDGAALSSRGAVGEPRTIKIDCLAVINLNQSIRCLGGELIGSSSD